jgi:hypothetical protein
VTKISLRTEFGVLPLTIIGVRVSEKQLERSSRNIAKFSYPEVEDTRISCYGTSYKWVRHQYSTSCTSGFLYQYRETVFFWCYLGCVLSWVDVNISEKNVSAFWDQMKMERGRSSEMLASTYETTRRQKPIRRHHSIRCETLKS